MSSREPRLLEEGIWLPSAAAKSSALQAALQRETQRAGPHSTLGAEELTLPPLPWGRQRSSVPSPIPGGPCPCFSRRALLWRERGSPTSAPAAPEERRPFLPLLLGKEDLMLRPLLLWEGRSPAATAISSVCVGGVGGPHHRAAAVWVEPQTAPCRGVCQAPDCLNPAWDGNISGIIHLKGTADV